MEFQDLNKDLDKIEQDLIEEDQDKRKEKMPVSGRSVFEVLRLKNRKTKTEEPQHKKN